VTRPPTTTTARGFWISEPGPGDDRHELLLHFAAPFQGVRKGDAGQELEVHVERALVNSPDILLADR